MAFENGHAKMGGRSKGKVNKTTGMVREALAPILEAYLSGEGLGKEKVTFTEDLVQMAPNDRAKAVAALVPYIVPKLTSVELKSKDAEKTFKDELEELSQEQEQK